MLHALLTLYGETPEPSGDAETGGDGSDGTKNTDDNKGQTTFTQAEVDKILGQRVARYISKQEEMETRLAAYEKDETERKAAESKRADEELKEKGEYEELLNKRQQQHETERDAWNAEKAKLTGELTTLKVGYAVDEALRTVQDIDIQMTPFIKQSLLTGTVLPSSDTFLKIAMVPGEGDAAEMVAVVGQHGVQVPSSNGGGFMTPKEAVEQFVGAYPQFKVSKGGGSGAPGGTTSTKAATDAEMAELFKKGQQGDSRARVRYMQLLREQNKDAT